MNHVIFLLRNHPGLLDHHAKAAGQRLVHRVGIMSVLEFPLGEAQGSRQRSGAIVRAVTIDAKAVVDFLPPLKTALVQFSNHARVIDTFLVLRQGTGRIQRGSRAQFTGSLRAPV